MTTAVTIQRDEADREDDRAHDTLNFRSQSRTDLVQIRRGFQSLDHELIDLSLLRRIHACNRRTDEIK